MNLSAMQLFGVIAMLAVTVALVFAYRNYLAVNSERRMLSMIESIGLDPAIASSSDLETIMGEVRKRCRSCTSEDVCERKKVTMTFALMRKYLRCCRKNPDSVRAN